MGRETGEIGVIWEQVKKCWQSTETGKGKKMIFLRVSGESMALLTS